MCWGLRFTQLQALSPFTCSCIMPGTDLLSELGKGKCVATVPEMMQDCLPAIHRPQLKF